MDHSHESSHAHGHDHAHAHSPGSFGVAFAIGIALNTIFVIVEGVYGYLGNSTALLADAGHNLGDVLGLLVAWTASVLARRAPSARFTYGLKGTSILAALFNAMFLLLTVGAIAWESAQRLGTPAPVAGKTVMVVATIGIAINGVTAWLFAAGRKGDINIRAAFLHMAADAVVSAGVVLAGGVILLTGRVILDPIVSLLICATIVWSTWSLLTDSVRMSLSAVPDGLQALSVRQFIEQMQGVSQLHDLHIWPMSTTETALTCHVVMPEGHPGDAFLMQAAHALQHKFSICHVTIQIETSEDTACHLAPDEVV
ncbi:MAG: cobalt-zinc-cadmium efflux system protein [Bradyrhizobium sp.]|nr:cobalt-zinc-cadmium efflux system protein [Bradyrhizobium sp.]